MLIHLIFQVLLDRVAYNDGTTNWAGFFSQDLMRASSYCYANVASRHNKPNELSFLFIDRTTRRWFTKHEKWVHIIKHYFKVVIFPYKYIEFKRFLSYYGWTVF